MKKIYFTLFSLFALTCSFAQPVFESDWVPSPGHISVNRICSEYPDAGPEGPNQTWDFSDMEIDFSFPAITFTFMAPEETPHFNLFPDANIANFLSFGGPAGGYGYYIGDEDGYSNIGSASQFSTTTYSDPQKGMCFPLNYGDSFDDPYEYVTESSGFTFETTATSTNVYDAYGTLILPTGTFNNVGRLSQYRNERDSLDFGVFASVDVRLDTTIGWIHPDFPSQLAIMNRVRTLTLEYGIGNPIPDTTANDYEITFSYDDQAELPGTTSTIDLDKAGLTMTPLGNPSSGMVQLAIGAETTGQYQLSVFHANGQQIHQYPHFLNKGENIVDVPLFDQVSGMYYLVIKNENGVFVGSSKVILQN